MEPHEDFCPPVPQSPPPVAWQEELPRCPIGDLRAISMNTNDCITLKCQHIPPAPVAMELPGMPCLPRTEDHHRLSENSDGSTVKSALTAPGVPQRPKGSLAYLSVPDEHSEETVSVSRQASMNSACGKRRHSLASKSQVLGSLAAGGSGSSDALSHDGLPEPIWRLTEFLQRVTSSTLFEAIMAGVIMANTVVLMAEIHYDGMGVGFRLSYPGSTRPAEDCWPGAAGVFKVFDWLFGIVFTMELVAKIIAWRLELFKDLWGWLDLVIVGFWLMGVFVGGDGPSFPVDPTIMRLVRLVRLLRMLRIVRTIKGFDSLYLLTTALKASFSALMWSTILVLLVQMTIALILNQMLQSYILDEANPEDQRHKVYRYYGTFSRAMLTMFELALANWPDPSRPLTEFVNEWYVLFVLGYQLVVGFAVVRVIMGVFLQVTFDVASTDDVLMVNQKERALKTDRTKMSHLFKVADDDGSGFLDKQEFRDIISDPMVVKWMAAMECDVSIFTSDPDMLYNLVDDDGDERLTVDELVEGVSRMKGPARSIDMAVLMYENHQIRGMMEEIYENISVIAKKQEARVLRSSVLDRHSGGLWAGSILMSGKDGATSPGSLSPRTIGSPDSRPPQLPLRVLADSNRKRGSATVGWQVSEQWDEVSHRGSSPSKAGRRGGSCSPARSECRISQRLSNMGSLPRRKSQSPTPSEYRISSKLSNLSGFCSQKGDSPTPSEGGRANSKLSTLSITSKLSNASRMTNASLLRKGAPEGAQEHEKEAAKEAAPEVAAGFTVHGRRGSAPNARTLQLKHLSNWGSMNRHRSAETVTDERYLTATTSIQSHHSHHSHVCGWGSPRPISPVSPVSVSTTASERQVVHRHHSHRRSASPGPRLPTSEQQIFSTLTAGRCSHIHSHHGGHDNSPMHRAPTSHDHSPVQRTPTSPRRHFCGTSSSPSHHCRGSFEDLSPLAASERQVLMMPAPCSPSTTLGHNLSDATSHIESQRRFSSCTSEKQHCFKACTSERLRLPEEHGHARATVADHLFTQSSGLPSKEATNWAMRSALSLGSTRAREYVLLSVEAVASPWFEALFAFLILANAFVIALEAQYYGIDAGYEIGYPGSSRSAGDAWPGAENSFVILDIIFGACFTIEVLLKMFAFGKVYLKQAWNWFDCFIVAMWFITLLVPLPLDPNLLRLLRLVKLLRITRLIRTIHGFDSLYLMTTSIKGSFSALGWAAVLLLLVEMMIVLILNQVLEGYILDESNPLNQRQEVFRYFGTFSKGMLTMFEITLANWAPVGRTLSESVSEWYTVFSLVHKFLIGFAVVMVITGVILQETFKVASSDDNIMMNQRERAMKTHVKKMENLFSAADKDESGYLDRSEFENIIQDPTVKTWLAAMGLEVSDVDTVFKLVDDGDCQLSAAELVKGVERLKGTARSIDLAVVMHENREMHDTLQDLCKQLTSLNPEVSTSLPPPTAKEVPFTRVESATSGPDVEPIENGRRLSGCDHLPGCCD